ncbi:hypothetical protein ACQ4PT_066629 [Festuca glaucescens]
MSDQPNGPDDTHQEEDGDATSDVDPADLYTLEEFIAEEDILESFVDEAIVGLKGSLEALQRSSLNRSGPRTYKKRPREESDQRLVNDYFSENPLYNDKDFRRRFRMRKSLFLHIVNVLDEWDPYFTARVDATQRQGLSPLQKGTSAIRQLAYGTPADLLDEYIKIGQSTSWDCLKKFAEGVIAMFGADYLRSPSTEDVERILHINESRGFPGMLGSLDCMHWHWEKCPMEWKGQFTRGDKGVPTLILEEVASQDLRIWHAYFSIPGSNNDINVLNQLSLFINQLKGQSPQLDYYVNNKQYKLGYYLVDGIYPEWAAFMKTVSLPQTPKHKLFAQHQEGARKDVERAFGVLQGRFSILRRLAHLHNRGVLHNIMLACIILHNMIVVDERENAADILDLNESARTLTVLPPVFSHGVPEFADVMRRDSNIRDRSTNKTLKNDLIEHIWEKFGPK